MSYFSAIQYNDSGSLDAFSRLRVSSTETLFSVQSQYNICPIEMEGGATGTGVAPLWNANTRMVALTCAAGTGVSYYQSYQYCPYEPGRSQFIACTGVLGTGVAGHVADYGYGDSLNGIFLRQNGASGLQVVQRSSTSGVVVNTIVDQANWNLDKMDGTGSSAITFDVTKAFILVMDLQFLGMGRVRFGFDINGVIYYFHQFLNANVLSVPYMQSASLPFSVTLTSTGSAAPKTIYFKCATVQSEGGSISSYGNDFCTPEATVTAGNGTRTHLISVRPKTTFGGVPNRALFLFNNLDLTVTGTAPIFYEIVVGAAFTVAPTFADVNTTNSAFEYGTGGTFGNLTTGIVVASGYIQSGTNWRQAIADKVALHYPITLDRTGAVRAMGTLSILVSGIGATSATRGAVGYTEIK